MNKSTHSAALYYNGFVWAWAVLFLADFSVKWLRRCWGKMVKLFAPTLLRAYTRLYMQQFLNNRYVRLTLLTLGIGLVFFLVIWLLTTLIPQLKGFPLFLQISLAFLASGVLVYKFLSQRVV